MGGAGFTDEDAREAWARGARAFEAFVESGADYYRREVHGPALLAACGSVHGLRALDLGCGHGYFTRELAAAGARVTGVDIAGELIAYARERESHEPFGIDYRTLGAAAIDAEWPAGSFDLVTSCMAVQDMADAGAVFRAAAAVLKDEGRMVFSVPHPCIDTPFREWERDAASRKRALKIDRYFETGPTVCDWNMPRLIYHWQTPCWRRTLAEWSDLVASAGFMIRRLHEPRPTEAQVQQNPRLEGCSRVPYFLIFDLVYEQPPR